MTEVITPLARRYPYVYAWAASYELTNGGRKPAPAEVQRTAEQAAADRVPDDVTWTVSWAVLDPSDYNPMRRSAHAGTVVIVNGPNGLPLRVWYRARHLIAGSRAHDAVTQYAENLKRGFPGNG